MYVFLLACAPSLCPRPSPLYLVSFSPSASLLSLISLSSVPPVSPLSLFSPLSPTSLCSLSLSWLLVCGFLVWFSLGCDAVLEDGRRADPALENESVAPPWGRALARVSSRRLLLSNYLSPKLEAAAKGAKRPRPPET